ncbi:unnamed protein product [Victoria cruziana]
MKSPRTLRNAKKKPTIVPLSVQTKREKLTAVVDFS